MAELEAAALPALAVDRSRRILFANATAKELLHSKRGLLSRAGCCEPANPADVDAVAALVGRVTSGGDGDLFRLRAMPGEAPLTLLATRPVNSGRSDVVILFIIDPTARRARATARHFQTIYGLTAAEADVAEAAIRGESAATIAAGRGTSEATVRAQLRAVLAKTGAGNLRALAVMAATLPDLPASPHNQRPLHRDSG